MTPYYFAVVNVTTGFVISYGMNIWLLPRIFGIEVCHKKLGILVGIFTVTALIRNAVVFTWFQ